LKLELLFHATNINFHTIFGDGTVKIFFYLREMTTKRWRSAHSE